MMSTFFPSASATLHNTSIPAYMIAEDARLSISPRSDRASENVGEKLEMVCIRLCYQK